MIVGYGWLPLWSEVQQRDKHKWECRSNDRHTISLAALTDGGIKTCDGVDSLHFADRSWPLVWLSTVPDRNMLAADVTWMWLLYIG